MGHSLGLYLHPEEIEAILEVHPPRDGLVDYSAFLPVAYESVLHMYGQRLAHPSDWAYLSSASGRVWFSKRTGELASEAPPQVLEALQVRRCGVWLWR